jgi:hypothetical protein
LCRFKSLLAGFRRCGVNAIMTESDAYSAAAINAAHDAGLRFYAGLSCFSDHASNFSKLRSRPELWPVLETGERRQQMEWYIGLSPADRKHQDGVLKRIGATAATHPLDGLFLDFVRWPLHWEIELRPGRPRPPDSSFDATTLARFEEATGVLIPSDLDAVSARASWIREQHFEQWVDFKCRVVTDFVTEARSALETAKPGAELGIYVVPNVDDLTEKLTGQRIGDLARLAHWLSPMIYHNILLRPPSWVGEAVADVVRKAGRKTLPVLQADSNRDPSLAADWGPPMSGADWTAALAEVATRSDVGGVIAFPGMALSGSDGRGEALRAMVGKWR